MSRADGVAGNKTGGEGVVSRRLVVAGPRRAALESYERPGVGPGEIGVRVEYASPKHGTELAVFRGEDPFAADLFDEDWRLFVGRDGAAPDNGERPVLGNQWVGVVDEVGKGVEGFQVGDRVCGYGGIQNHHVVDVRNAPYLLKVPKEMPWKSALCLDPAQYALCGVRDANLRVGDAAVVFGLGAIGAIAAQVAKRAGAPFVAVVDPIPKRRKAALARAEVKIYVFRRDRDCRCNKWSDAIGITRYRYVRAGSRYRS